MIINNDYLNRNKKINYLQEEKKGLNKAIANYDKRFKNNEIERESFLKGLKEFSKKQINLNKRIEKQQ